MDINSSHPIVIMAMASRSHAISLVKILNNYDIINTKSLLLKVPILKRKEEEEEKFNLFCKATVPKKVIL